jgi:hypothetical protein
MYEGKHRANKDTDVFDPTHGPDEYEVEVLTELLTSGLLPDTERLGDGAEDDWKLSILAALAGRGDEWANDYLAPRLVTAAQRVCDEIGFGMHGYIN